MLTLCMDTAYKFLSVCLIKDDKVVRAVSRECVKRQSEEIFEAMGELFDEEYNKNDIDSVCISIGPGSYTGVRIALTVAKVLCISKAIDLYIISTLKLYAGGKRAMVIMDARSSRAYVGAYEHNNTIICDCVCDVACIDAGDYEVILDGSLIGKENINPDIPECFLNTKKAWEKVSNINFLTPEYLKENTAYFK